MLPTPSTTLFLPAGLAFVVAGCAAGVIAAVGRPGQRRLAGVCALALIAAGAALSVVPAGRVGEDWRSEPRRMLPVPGVRAWTDEGTPVPLGRPREEAAGGVPDEFAWRAIAAHPAAASANCHGWVFAEGRYWIPTESIDAILADNGYHLTDQPLPGDLIIYRDDRGRPFHSGIVKAVGSDHFVLVESKWGALPVFWHTPEHQAFGDRLEYRRSDRQGHSLRIEEGPVAR